jgi:hypothetical protein
MCLQGLDKSDHAGQDRAGEEVRDGGDERGQILQANRSHYMYFDVS